MSLEPAEFRDEELRQAMRRALPSGGAPEELRQRVMAAMQSADALPMPQRRWGDLFRGHRIAIAASIVGLLGGYVIYQVTSESPQTQVASSSSSTSSAAPLPQPVAYSLAQQHLDMLSQSPGQLSLPDSDYQTMRQALQQRLRLNMPASELRQQGWRFRGASACQLNSHDGAHFRFARGKESLSLFVLPRITDLPAGNVYYSAETATAHGNAPVLCKVQGDTLLCLTGSAADRQPMSLRQLRPLLDAVSLH